MWKGEHRGCNVAVKVLRVYSTSDFDKITSVSSYHSVKRLAHRLMLDRAEILQRGSDLESTSTSKRAATVGGDDGKLPIRDGIGVDGKREHQ